jgi:hypothetical protein
MLIKRRVMDQIKREAGKIGGAKRAAVLPPARRLEIARQGAAARWGKPAMHATHKGSFKEEFGIDVDCYVLDDAHKTAVMSQRGMAEAIGLSPGSGGRLPAFLGAERMANYIGRELREKLANPLVFQGIGAVAGTTIHGYDCAILVDICRAIVQAEADGKLSARRYDNLVRQAHVILGASAKAGIRGLVYSLAGYSPTAEEVITAFKLYVQEEARKYEQEFPNELYQEWHRLYEIPVPVRGKPWQFKHLTVKHVWFPLAKSNGKILQLVRALKAKEGDRQKKLFQFLSEVGARALSRHIGRVQEIAETSVSAAEYETRINERFGDQRELDFIAPPPPSAALPSPKVDQPVVPSLPLFDRAPGALPE